MHGGILVTVLGPARARQVGIAGVHGIPWALMLPLDIEGIVVAGRCLSATHDAHASARTMATCTAMGQAAGTAAAMAAATGDGPREVDPGRLRQQLVADDSFVEPFPAAQVP